MTFSSIELLKVFRQLVELVSTNSLHYDLLKDLFPILHPEVTVNFLNTPFYLTPSFGKILSHFTVSLVLNFPKNYVIGITVSTDPNVCNNIVIALWHKYAIFNQLENKRLFIDLVSTMFEHGTLNPQMVYVILKLVQNDLLTDHQRVYLSFLERSLEFLSI
jgi:hypothetical protein